MSPLFETVVVLVKTSRSSALTIPFRQRIHRPFLPTRQLPSSTATRNRRAIRCPVVTRNQRAMQCPVNPSANPLVNPSSFLLRRLLNNIRLQTLLPSAITRGKVLRHRHHHHQPSPPAEEEALRPSWRTFSNKPLLNLFPQQ